MSPDVIQDHLPTAPEVCQYPLANDQMNVITLLKIGANCKALPIPYEELVRELPIPSDTAQ
jgi:hypothetical protein